MPHNTEATLVRHAATGFFSVLHLCIPLAVYHHSICDSRSTSGEHARDSLNTSLPAKGQAPTLTLSCTPSSIGHHSTRTHAVPASSPAAPLA
jgi:hypothetical protein